jgi:hypothetical protein
MTPDGKLLASIEPLGAEEFVAAFVGEVAAPGAPTHTAGRAPGTQLCSFPEDARQWVEKQAAAFDLPIKWVSRLRRTQKQVGQ